LKKGRTTDFYGPRKKIKAVVGAVSNRDELGLANSIIVVASHPPSDTNLTLIIAVASFYSLAPNALCLMP
jgi:hypothetical protein